MQKLVTDSFETINNASGGVVGDVVGGIKDAATETAKDIASSPLDILESLIGGPTSQQSNDPSIENLSSGTTQDPQDPKLQQKMIDDQKAKQEKLKQHREMLAQYEQQFKQSQAQQQQEKQVEEQQEEQKKAQIVQLKEQKKQESLAVQNAKQMGGSHESMKKPM